MAKKNFKKIVPFYNHGRWLARCPSCGQPNIVESSTEMFICGECYPEKLKKRAQVLPTGQVMIGYDQGARREAKIHAYTEGNVYIVDWHRNASAIERELKRRKVIHQSYIPEEELENFPEVKEADTLHKLRAEIDTDPRLKYLREEEQRPEMKKEAAEEIKEKQKMEDVPEKVLRSIK